MKQTIKLNSSSSLFLLSVFMFSLLLISFVFFSTFATLQNAYADASTDTEVDLNVATVINISTPNTTTINCASLNTLCTANTTITVGTNNITGYTLQLNATSGYSNSLTNAATNETIPTLSQSYAAASFPTNYWGYTGGLDKSSETGGYNCASNYCPVLAYQSTESNYAPNHAIKITNAPANASNTTITFGAKADITKPSGTYSTSVTFTAVTNYVPHPITNGMSMTDIDANTCSDTPTETTYTVVDPRDNKSYAVAKLADDNCWMLDNLALDLIASKNNITSSNTNASDTYLNYLKNGGGTASDQYPTAGVSYWTSTNSYSVPLIAIKNANDDTWNPDTIASVTYGNGSGKIGIYYNYCAASASSYCYGNGTDYTGSPSSDPKSGTLYDIDADICPAGWHMPTTTYNGEYYYLFNTAYSANGTNFKNALSTPLSGSFNNGSAVGGGLGSYGFFWSSTWEFQYANNMDVLITYSNSVNPAASVGRSSGLSLRCVINGS